MLLELSFAGWLTGLQQLGLGQELCSQVSWVCGKGPRCLATHCCHQGCTGRPVCPSVLATQAGLGHSAASWDPHAELTACQLGPTSSA